MPKITTQLAMIAAIVILGAIIVFAGPAACQKIRSMGAQSRVSASQAQAASNSAADAIGTVARSGEAEAASEALTHINETNVFGIDTIAEPTSSLTLDIEPQSVLSAVKQLCDQYGMGFRLAKNLDEPQLYFNIYMGCNRTSRQTTYPAVIFSPGLDNLQNTSEIKSIAPYKNVAYVFGQTGYAVVYADNVDPTTITGLNRRVLMVTASDIDDLDPTTLQANLQQRGLDELAKNRQVSAFDGEISQHSAYLYGRDYNLGDLVELQNTSGSGDDMRVTEQIFVSDKEGERRYPTLELNQYIQPGSWAAWDFSQVWEDLGDTEYWGNQE